MFYASIDKLDKAFQSENVQYMSQAENIKTGTAAAVQATSGVPRFKEIFSASKKIKTLLWSYIFEMM